MASPKLELNLVQVVAGTLAAVSAAFALSKLGIGGTLTGAAVASVVAGIGSSLYQHSIHRAKEQLKRVIPVTELAEQHPESFPTDDDGPHTGALPGAPGLRPDGSVPVIGGRPEDGPETRVIRPAAVGMARVPTGTLYAPAPAKRRTIPTWASVTIAVVSTFLLALGTIEVVERLVLGESMASVFNKSDHRGSTLFGGTNRQDPAPAPSPTPSESPHDREPPPESPGPSPSTPSPTPSTSPSGSPSPSATPTPTPSGKSATPKP
ncbi:hypothetical protein Lfu02_26900 [Longispora fulva]|uniref:Uncharacterized protein n=1 Tax=Longispora fulva TaxID=619741 RepID=A0A8J7GV64_9ACTN|nr:hypothetical protein [Longispora fulva]MBG6138823.1 hypothetical protein [Longispora fulva]GIG58318.1 hypothetical protein Lfu02_26900 [Longispora fulva]